MSGRSSSSSIRLLLVGKAEHVQRGQGEDLGALDDALDLDVFVGVVRKRPRRSELDERWYVALADHDARVCTARRGFQVRFETQDLVGPVAGQSDDRATGGLFEIAAERDRGVSVQGRQLPGEAAGQWNFPQGAFENVLDQSDCIRE